MNKILNVIWIILLAVAWGSLTNVAKAATKEAGAEISLELSYQSAIESPRSSIQTDAEIGGIITHNSISLLRGNHGTGTLNLHLLKADKKLHVWHDNSLAKHVLKSALPTAFLPMNTPCEYYIFTLKQLLI